MTNKIVILQNSVELYEHYINDEKWEKTLSFPKGGLTYNISNGTIKFFAFEDYLYRNCLMSMQLPIYIVDDEHDIDGEYSDIGEIVEILDDIFPIYGNGEGQDLSLYLKKKEAAETYQPIGDYALRSEIPDVEGLVTDEELVEALEDYYTKDEADDLLDDKADKDDVYTKDEADARFQPIGDYVSGDTFSAYTADTEAVLSGKADADDVYTKDESDARFQPIGDYLNKASADTIYQPIGDYLTSADTYSKQEVDDKLDGKLDVSAYTPCDLSNYYRKDETSGKTEIEEALSDKQDKLIAGTNIVINGNVISATNGGGGGIDPDDYYTKAECDERFMQKTDIPEIDDMATQTWVLNQNFATEYTLNTYITNLQEQINSLTETISGCCSHTGETIYRWITLTNDFICSGTTKYNKEQKQQSTDGGISWTNVVPAEYRQASTGYPHSIDCGYVEPEKRWVEIPNQYICKGNYCKYHVIKLQYSYDSGTTWVDSEPLQTANGSLVNCKNYDCGYRGCKYCAEVKLSGDSTVYHPDTWVENNYEMYGYDGQIDWRTTQQGWWNTHSTSITSITFNQCVKIIDDESFTAIGGGKGYWNLTYVDLPDSLEEIGWRAFHTRTGNNCRLKTVIIRATIPPTLSPWETGTSADGYTFSTQGGLKIYVPDESVDLYINAERWFRYADRIYPLSALNS